MPTIPIPLFGSAPGAVDPPVRPRCRDIESRYCWAAVARPGKELERLVTAQLRGQAHHAMDLWPEDALAQGLLLDVVKTTNRVLGGDNSLSLDPDPLSGVIESQVKAIVLEFEEQRGELDRVSADARSRSSPGVSDMRIEADQLLKCGMGSSGFDRDGHFDTAIKLLHVVARDINGAGDGTVWFQIGWLQWQHAGNLPAAEDAFTRAITVASDLTGTFAEMLSRHLAYVRYERGDYEGAWAALAEAEWVSERIGARFDQARYASLTGRDDESAGLLLGCLKERPALLLAMLADEDFGGVPGRPTSVAAAATESARDEGKRRIEELGTVVQRLYTACERAAAMPVVSSGTYAERMRKLESKLASADLLRCAPIVDDGNDIAREALDLGRKALNVRAAEQQRREKEVRNVLKAAAARRAKDVQNADKSLAGSLRAAERSARAEARQTANWSLVLNLSVMGVAVGVITAMLAMKASPDTARQDGGLMLALGLTFGVPAIVFIFAKYQNPGLDDWLRLAAEREFAKEFPRKADALKTARDAVVVAADDRHAAATREAQQGLDTILEYVKCLDATSDRIELLRTRAQL